MSKVIFNNNKNAFYQSLKEGVDDYFIKNKIKKTGDVRLFAKAIVLPIVAVAIYTTLLFAPLASFVAILLCIVLGFTLSCIGFCIMHDANHGSFSSRPWVNDLFSLSLNALGANSYFWKQKHNIIHHTYTNVDGIDDDIAKSPIIRQCDTQKWVPLHKVQHIYLPAIYSLATLFWIYIMDFTKYFGRKIYRTDAWRLSWKNHVEFWVTKIYYAAIFIVIPIFFLGWQSWLIGYLIVNMTLGITLSFVFQLAHVVENTEFEYIPLDETKQLETAWAEHQLKTTSNFAMGNKTISWLVGGLNYQVEHHLFPRVSHVHYPAISKIVQQKCREYNFPYNSYPTLSSAIASHFRVMRYLGKSPGKLVIPARAAA